MAMGKGMEAITGGVCVATTHRVIAPAAGEGSRFSIPFFQGVSYDTRYESIEIPEEVKKLKRGVVKGDAETSPKPGDFRLLGEATLVNRVKVWLIFLSFLSFFFFFAFSNVNTCKENPLKIKSQNSVY